MAKPQITFSSINFSPKNEYYSDTIKNKKIRPVSFTGYLTDSQVTYEILDSDLPFWSFNFPNGKIANRITQSIKISFDVYAEDAKEHKQNNEKIKILRNILRPVYYKEIDGHTHTFQNNNGLVSIITNCLPIKEPAVLNVTNFSYTINKEFGFIKDDNNNLNPVSYNISIEGKILQNFEQTVNIIKAEKNFKVPKGRTSSYTDQLDIQIASILQNRSPPIKLEDFLANNFNLYIQIIEGCVDRQRSGNKLEDIISFINAMLTNMTVPEE